MRRRLIRSLLIGLAAVLVTYVALAITAGRPISPDEYAIYTSAIVRAALGHASEAGGVHALQYVRAALAEPSLTAQLAGGATQLAVPLPPHTSRQPETAEPNRYISFATDAEMIVYLTQTMPRAGWQHVDQLGGSQVFSSGTRKIVLSERYLL